MPYCERNPVGPERPGSTPTSGGRWFGVGEQPGVEEPAELLPGHPLGQVDEVARGGVAVAVPGCPLPDQPEEVAVTDLLPQRLQGHRAAVVHRAVEDAGDAGSRRRRAPQVAVLRLCVQLVELLGGGDSAVVLGPQPLGVGCPTLVQPDVRPATRADGIAEPLVRELVGDGALRRRAGVDRPGLRLEGVAGVRVVVDDRAERPERVPPEARGEEVDHLAGPREGVVGGIR